jgi:hypothetical protein
MESHNYCLVKKNKLYEDLYEILEEEELIMDNPNHKDTIKYKIKTLAKSYFNNKISISNTFSSSNDSLEDLMLEITKSTEKKIENPENVENVENTENLEDVSLQGNTLLMFADSEAMYEVVFMEQVGILKSDAELNQMASISNIELAPIYGSVSIVKSSYINGKLKNALITYDDIVNIITNNFYHMGVMINCDGSTKELEFSGDNPNIMIGGNFKQMAPSQMFGLTLVGYNEEGSEINNMASELYGKEIKGRFYVTSLCPITNNRFWGITLDIVQNLIKLIKFSEGTAEEKKIIENLNSELADDKLKNPFFLLKKYCV